MILDKKQSQQYRRNAEGIMDINILACVLYNVIE